MPAMSMPLHYGEPPSLLTAPGNAFSFDGDVVVKHEYDMDWDGKPDRVYHYRRGSIQRADFDLDRDGEFDLRATYEKPAKGASNMQYQLVKIGNDYRLMPSATVATYPSHNHFYLAGPPPRYEARIDGAWRDSFTIDLPLPMVQYEQDEAKGVMSFVCRDGAAVSLTTEVQPGVSEEYQQTLFNNGKVSRYVTGASPERIHQKIRYTYGEDSRSVTQSDSDGDGEFDHEYTRQLPDAYASVQRSQRLTLPPLFYYDPGLISTRIKIDGQWTGTFVDQFRRYVDGRLTKVYAHHTERVVQRYAYDKAGQLLLAESDRDGDGVFDYRSNADGTLQKRVHGRWVGDFELSRSMGEIEMGYTYRDGRLVRYEGDFPKEGRHTVFESPEPGVHIVKESGVFRPSLAWYYYAVQPDGAASPLLRSAHDIDADGKPDVFVDYPSLTITETRPADWPG